MYCLSILVEGEEIKLWAGLWEEVGRKCSASAANSFGKLMDKQKDQRGFFTEDSRRTADNSFRVQME